MPYECIYMYIQVSKSRFDLKTKYGFKIYCLDTMSFVSFAEGKTTQWYSIKYEFKFENYNGTNDRINHS